MKGKNIKKIITSVLAAAFCALSLTGCSTGGTSSDSSDSSDVSTVSSDTESSDTSTTESTSSESSNSDDILTPPTENIKVVALKGPTAMGLTKLMDDNEKNGFEYDFSILAAPDEISPMAAQGTADIFCVPANLAAVLCNKTEGKLKAIAINTLGVLYICENGDTVTKIADLKGKTIYSAGKGSTPEYALNFILSSNGIDPEKDVTIEWKSEHAECLSAMLSGENCVAMLPQPFVTTAQSKNEGVRVAIDLNDAWDELGVDSTLITGAAIVRTEFAEKNPAAVDRFLEQYAQSVDYVNANIDEAAALIEKYDIVPAAVAKKAIPNCHIVCITGGEMKDKLSGYLKVLFDNDPTSVGGALPADTFYYIGG